ncbi:MAG: O-antigen ligase family protein [Acidobacteriota bacterium]|nr:O-antigen ligase family protein [Acidobacteriota bacterium]
MNPDTRRTLLRHALAIDLILVASGVAMLAPSSPLLVLLAFIGAIAVAAWYSEEEAGLAATAYGVVTLSLFFTDIVDVGTLTAFAATGAFVSTFSRAARRIRQADAAATVEAPVAEAAVEPAAAQVPKPFGLGLPLLVFVLYADISEVLMKRYPVPSLLRPLIVFLAIVVWRSRRACRPMSAAVQAPIIVLVIYDIVCFASGAWAHDIGGANAWFSEVVKATMICVLAASLAVSWSSLKRSLIALIATCVAMSSISIVQVTTGKFTDILFGFIALEQGNIYGDVSSGRAAGPPVSDPNFYARILLVSIPLAVGLAIAAKKRSHKIAYGAAALIVTGGTLVTYSRGAMLALGAMSMIMVFAMRVKPRHAFAGALCALLAIPFLPEGMKQRFLTVGSAVPGETNERVDSSVAKRRLLMGVSLLMFDEHLLTGVGSGNFAERYSEYAPRVGMAQRDYGVPGNHEFPHGLYFELAAENGLLGLSTFIGAAVAAWLVLLRARRELLARGEDGRAAIASGVGVAIAGYMLASVFLHESHVRYYGLYLGLAVAVARLSRGVAAVDEAAPAELAA